MHSVLLICCCVSKCSYDNGSHNKDVDIQGYFSLSQENRHKLLLILAREYDLNRTQVRDLMKQYVGLEIPNGESPFVTTLHFGFKWFGCKKINYHQVM